LGIDTTDVLLSHRKTAQKLFRLTTGTYHKLDSYRKHFYSFLGNPPEGIEAALQDLLGTSWEPEDIYQEIYLEFHKTVLRYFSRKGRKTRRRPYSLKKLLYLRGTLRLTTIIRQKLTSRQREALLAPLPPPAQPVPLSPLGAIAPNRLFKICSHLTHLPIRDRVFLYRFLVEDKSLNELKSEFGGEYKNLREILDRVGEALYPELTRKFQSR